MILLGLQIIWLGYLNKAVYFSWAVYKKILWNRFWFEMYNYGKIN